MNCIFCEQSSEDSTSVEHIIPESLGNKEFILAKGWVCDKCNNYISRKIEQPLLQMPFFIQHRHDLDVKSKKGKIPSKSGFFLDKGITKIDFHKDNNKEESIETESRVLEQLLSENINEIPAITVTLGAPPPNIFISKFLGKIGIELLAYEAIKYGFDESYYNQESLINIKRYVRRGEKNKTWPYFSRQVYHPDSGFKDDTGYFKVICTWKFIVTPAKQLLFQFLFVGTEFTINLINPDMVSIEQWFSENNHKSVTFESLVNQFGSKT